MSRKWHPQVLISSKSGYSDSMGGLTGCLNENFDLSKTIQNFVRKRQCCYHLLIGLLVEANERRKVRCLSGRGRLPCKRMPPALLMARLTVRGNFIQRSKKTPGGRLIWAGFTTYLKFASTIHAMLPRTDSTILVSLYQLTVKFGLK